MREDRELEVDFFEKDEEFVDAQTLSLSEGNSMVANRDFRRTFIFDSVKVIEDIELAAPRVNQALEHLFRTVKPGGQFIISKELWEKAQFQPSLRGLFFSKKYKVDEEFIVFFV